MIQVKSFEFNPLQENTYILYNEFNECLIIDPGCYFEDEKQMLIRFIENNHLKPVFLLNTHCHLDHVFGNEFISEKYHLKLHIHADEKKVLDHAPVSGLMYNLPFDNYRGALVYLEPGKEILLGDDVLEILFTPGHSPGSLSFYNAKAGFVISGDVLFQQSIGRTDLPGGDFDTLIDSIRTRLLTLPADTKIYSGHGPMTTVKAEIQYNPFLQ